MQSWSADELREQFLAFFESKGHQRLPSAPLVPKGDPTLLLTGAGMVPFKPYFLGKAKPEFARVTTCQRCLRTPDIDNVGRTDRHGTFFEMLGNFSFGDYFKHDAIHWAWEFVTQHLQFDTGQLWVSIYYDDEEAFTIWRDKIGVPADRIVRLGREDNFWEIGVGPCGPCSEIYLDRGAEHGCSRPDCQPGCDCDRYLEFWNLVFIQYFQDADGELHPLEAKGIDTGMGLDRTAAVLQDAPSIFDTDNVRPIVDQIAQRAGVRYGEQEAADVSLRVITDHMRGVVFMVFDGIIPGNEGRGYVLRRLLRRAVRHARLLGIEGIFLPDVVDQVIAVMRPGYPDLPSRRDYLRKVILQEEERFHETLDQGMAILEDLMENLRQAGATEISGTDAFRLYDTYGFPMELTREIAGDRGFIVDQAGFDEAMAQQRQRARAARSQTGYLGDSQDGYQDVAGTAATRFVGYENLELETTVVALLVDGVGAGVAEKGQRAELMLEATPFYAEGGGQVGDTGTITTRDGQFEVEDVKRPVEGIIVHQGHVTSGRVAVGDTVMATVYAWAREETQRNHTATHLLHQALRDILGDHAQQAGSLVAPERLRFDFTHFEPVTAEQLFEIERTVNEHIMADLPVSATYMSLDEARRLGAQALFDEKYGDQVRVVSIGEYSRELCGGTHVGASGRLGLFRILAEGGVAAGIRRIEAVTGKGALRVVDHEGKTLRSLAERLRVAPERAPQQLDNVLAQVREMERELDALRGRVAASQTEALLDAVEKVGSSQLLVAKVPGTDNEGLRAMGDRLRDRLGSGVVVLGAEKGGKALFIAMATPDMVEKGVHAGEVIRAAAQVAGGGGGGQPHMAQAGGKDPQKLAAALEKARAVIEGQLGVAHQP